MEGCGARRTPAIGKMVGAAGARCRRSCGRSRGGGEAHWIRGVSGQRRSWSFLRGQGCNLVPSPTRAPPLCKICLLARGWAEVTEITRCRHRWKPMCDMIEEKQITPSFAAADFIRRPRCYCRGHGERRAHPSLVGSCSTSSSRRFFVPEFWGRSDPSGLAWFGERVRNFMGNRDG